MNPKPLFAHPDIETPAAWALRAALFSLLAVRFPQEAERYQGCFFYSPPPTNDTSGSGLLGDRFMLFGYHARITAKLSQTELIVEHSVRDSDGPDEITEVRRLPADKPHRIYEPLFGALGELSADDKGDATGGTGWFGGWHSFSELTQAGEVIARFYRPEVIVDLQALTIEFSDPARAEEWQPLTASDLSACAVIAAKIPAPRSARVNNAQTCQDYVESLTDLLGHFDDGQTGSELQKIVVARTNTIQLAEPAEMEDILAQVASSCPKEGFAIMFKEGSEDAWLSVTPELLMETVGDRITVAPLAGTRKSASDDRVAAPLRAELASDDKEQREHAFAADLMTSSLLPLVKQDSLRATESQSIVDLGYVQHIKTTLMATLNEHTTATDALAQIYPPATIWGLPVAGIAEHLARFEPFKREYFTGGYGYLDYRPTLTASGEVPPARSRFALFIRCARLSADDRTLTAFAGSGIVLGSDPVMEWQETAHKMRPFTHLGGETP